METQLVVVGGGPGGYAAAFLAADLGMQVTLVEAEPRLGGTCLLKGCIPSKALLHVARVISESARNERVGRQLRRSVDRYRRHAGPQGKGDPTPRRRAEATGQETQSASHPTPGRCSRTRRRCGSKGAIRPPTPSNRLTFEHCILASGSIPAMPSAFKLPTDRVMDSTGALELADVPESLLVIGGGYIGLEMGTVYAELGIEGERRRTDAHAAAAGRSRPGQAARTTA